MPAAAALDINTLINEQNKKKDDDRNVQLHCISERILLKPADDKPSITPMMHMYISTYIKLFLEPPIYLILTSMFSTPSIHFLTSSAARATYAPSTTL